METVALTGATGFVGQNMLEHLQMAGLHVRALTRRPQHATVSDSNLDSTQGSLTWVEGSLENSSSLSKLCQGADTVIHIAGLTKARSRSEFFDVNMTATSQLAQIAQDCGVEHFILLSSLAAREPQLSHYGASKLGGEQTLAKQAETGLGYTILRPPAIYGPGEKEILKIIQRVSKFERLPFFPAMGGRKAKVSFIHVYDLCTALLALINAGPQGKTFEIDDCTPGGYGPSDLAKAFTGNEQTDPYLLPLYFWTVSPLGFISDLWTALTGQATMTSLSHLRYLSHPDWVVQNEARLDIADWSPQYSLFSGMKQTRAWAKEKGLL